MSVSSNHKHNACNGILKGLGGGEGLGEEFSAWPVMPIRKVARRVRKKAPTLARKLAMK